MKTDEERYVSIVLDKIEVCRSYRPKVWPGSMYRQIGLGCELLPRAIVQDQLGLSEDEVKWSYTVKTAGGRKRTLALDARISPGCIADEEARQRVKHWLATACASVEVADDIAASLHGAVLEVRQGYKSKDAKRLSNQIDSVVAERYRHAGWLLLRGTTAGDETSSTYAFARAVLDYDLAAFLERNSDRFRDAVLGILDTLLGATDAD